MTITITLLVLIALGFILYKNYSDNKLTNIDDPKNTATMVKNFLDKMIPQNNESAQTSVKVMTDLDITEAKFRILAANIADRDSFRVAQMKGLYVQYLGNEYDVASSTYRNMMKDMTTLRGDALAKEYVKEMIKHHNRTIDDANDYIKLIDKIRKESSNTENGLTVTTSHPAIDDSYDFALQIIKDYQSDIDTMKSF